MSHPLLVKSSNVASWGAAIPLSSLAVGLGASTYGAVLSKSRDIGKGSYRALTSAGVDDPPSQKTIDAILARNIMDMDAEAMKDLQADIIVQYLSQRESGKRKGKR